MSKTGYFSKRWPSGQCLDIYDAIGDMAMEISDMVETTYICNFPPIVDHMEHLPDNIQMCILLNRLGIRQRVIEHGYITCTYLTNLYHKLEGSNEELIVPEDGELRSNLVSCLLHALPNKYRVLKDESITKEVLTYLYCIDEWMIAIDVLGRYSDAMKYLIKRNPWNAEDNYFYLVIMAIVSKQHPNLKGELTRIMNDVGIYSIGDPSTYVLESIHTYPREILYKLTIDKPKLWFNIQLIPRRKEKIVFRTTDQTMIHALGVILPYSNYKHHIDLYLQWKKHAQVCWNIPTDYTLKKHGFDETTLTMENVDQAYIIAYGSNFYSTTEIYEAIRVKDPVRWDLPGFPEKPQYKDYKDLLYFAKVLNLEQITRKIEEYITLHDEIHYNPDVPYREFFNHIVEIGLYARRWLGPGHPFPYKKKDADNLKVNPEVNITPLIHKCRVIVQHWRDTPRFKIFNRSGVCGTNFLDYMKTVFEGQECIRIASYKFIWTGMYYLNQMYNTGYSDLDLDRLCSISLVAPEE